MTSCLDWCINSERCSIWGYEGCASADVSTTSSRRPKLSNLEDPQPGNDASDPISSGLPEGQAGEPQQELEKISEEELREKFERKYDEAMEILKNSVFQLVANVIGATRKCEGIDVVVYDDKITMEGYRRLREICLTKPSSNVFLVLRTEGGDPHAAYKCARILQDTYHGIWIYIPGDCMSAGTLIACAGHKLLFSNAGQLGPLDIQISKENDPFQMESSEIISAAFNSLEEKSMAYFKHAYLSLKSSTLLGHLSSNSATEIAASLTKTILGEIYKKFDVKKIGDVERKRSLATMYVHRIAGRSNNLHPNAIETLVTGYPDHRFVIDHHEAKKLFIDVEMVQDPNIRKKWKNEWMNLADSIEEMIRFSQEQDEKYGAGSGGYLWEGIRMFADLMGEEFAEFTRAGLYRNPPVVRLVGGLAQNNSASSDS